MGSMLMKGIIRKGRVEVSKPIDLPDGTEVIVSSKSSIPDDGPMTPEEIAAILSAMQQIQPFEMTPEEEAAIEAGRLKSKAYTLANMHKGIEELFP